MLDVVFEILEYLHVAWAGLARLRQQLRRAPGDEELQALVAVAEAAVVDLPRRGTPLDDLVMCPHFRFGDRVIRTIAMVARFDTAVDVTLDDVRIELMYPRDAASERIFRELAESGPAEGARPASLPESSDDEQCPGQS
jgi:hypothetical protein